ncbi:MAG: DUF1553 domain-containing protein [Bryobacteraceae bacterium]|nr:DUF1553 domain-containing protein [Bryobacteraceae bacterium]MDW8377609.1 DUF1553 domain-containing protein [Bryobacterales bacterium]
MACLLAWIYALAGCLLGTLATAAPPAGVGDSKTIDFNRDIRPVLSDHCFACHGPDEKKRFAGVRLDTKEGALKVVTPGDAAKSRLFARITHADPARRMPPPAAGKALSQEQIERIKRWIDAGAEYKGHWAYEPPQRPPLPPVQNKRWPRNPIDYFVLARLEREGLSPSPEADRITLLRRLSLDLTGLPPTPAEIDAFLRDKSPDAYEKQVDRLLASPHYGERMAMQWLDLARYADTHGFHIDSHRDMWVWRDWVIRAFNQNMPFDRFTIEQLAGDLLPNASLEQRIASGFNRNHMINYEGGAIPEEYHVEYVADRVETTSTVWMAATMGCARCHDHKYDPFHQAEYYKLFAFFNNVPEKGLDGRDGNAEPFLRLPDEGQKQRLEQLTARLAALEATLAANVVEPEFQKWEKERLKTIDFGGAPQLRQGLVAHFELDGGFTDSSGRYVHGVVLRGEPALVQTPIGRAMEFPTQSHVRLGDMGLRLEEGFTVAAWLMQGHHEPQTVLRQGGVFELWYDASEPLPHLRRGAHLHMETPGRHWRTRERLVQRDHYHIALQVQGGSVLLRVNGEPVPLVELAPEMKTGVRGPLEIGQAEHATPRHGFRGRLADLRIYARALSEGEVRILAFHHRIAHLLAIPTEKRTKEQRETLRDYFLSHEAPEPLRAAYLERKQLQKAKAALEDEIPTTMVMAELEKPRDTHILGRGDYRNKGEKVTPDVPAVLPPLPPGEPRNRLTLARWLVSGQHPLTARVTVNRYWQNYFGLGLVKSSENFGSQGDPPTHPELLDWLATEFVASGWDVKAMQRLIVTSATYRQSSKARPELLERDPENRLLARMSRFRLPAEMVRDQALAVSGLLNRQIGGRSVFPYQPAGIWEEIARGEIFSAQVYKQSSGRDLYRRSMYWFWKRTAPPPSLVTFDAPDREKCVARRSVTNTPLQALVLMNDPTFVEAARVLAERVLDEAGSDPRLRVRHAFRLVTGRNPQPRELRLLETLASKQQAYYASDSEAAAGLLQVGESRPSSRYKPEELAAWTNVASVILNLDEAVSKE